MLADSRLSRSLTRPAWGADRGQAFQHVHLWRAERKPQNRNLVAASASFKARHVGDQRFRRQGVAVHQQACHGGIDDCQKHVVDAARLGLATALTSAIGSAKANCDRRRPCLERPWARRGPGPSGHCRRRRWPAPVGRAACRGRGGGGRGGGLPDRAADEFSQRAFRRGLGVPAARLPKGRAMVLSEADATNQFETTWTNVRPSMMA